jgi:hypothetical protein
MVLLPLLTWKSGPVYAARIRRIVLYAATQGVDGVAAA